MSCSITELTACGKWQGGAEPDLGPSRAGRYSLSTRDDIANGARVRHIDQPIGRDSVGRFGDQHSLALDQVPDSRDCCPFPNATELRQKSGHFWNTLRVARSLRHCGHDYSNRCSHRTRLITVPVRPTLLSPPSVLTFARRCFEGAP